MMRDFKFPRRNSGKIDEIENVPVNPRDIPAIQPGTEPPLPPPPPRAPLNAIQEPRPELEASGRGKIERTPVKPKGRGVDPALPLRTPEKHGGEFSAKKRFGWAQKAEPSSAVAEGHDDGRAGFGNGGFMNMTPRSMRTVGRATPSYTESNSTQSTPTKSVNKVLNLGTRGKADVNGGARGVNFAALYKGVPVSSGSGSVLNTVEVPHFDLKEDSSFWMDHNVQVIIRIRPLNSMERSTQGYNRCLKQESSQCVTYIGQPETRFTFDHVACETIDQETLFRMTSLPMVENCLSGYNSCMFAYGQTGSGKTYTMLGEIDDLEMKPSPHRGMTPRIFEFLFARIQAEEESRRDEKLKYNCKCSFLEIYNEQITDLLDPSSTNLLIREDAKAGVYVENLSEFEVYTVSDILRLLMQGSSNRRVAATNMNRESSRSHSVFTCVIESRWEKDSTSNLRFARLNLVDLAGSERQKTSGAEGERLKEAANINKSLSTLGHVIMVLVDLANGRPRHIPYRDSRLTFLLQDSLGGNSKTMIIANVSPSICSAAETLNTLKFAQRAKLIQNNAVVNEDSTGDVSALRHQIRLLQEELSILKRQNISRALSFGSGTIQNTAENAFDLEKQLAEELPGFEPKGTVRMSTKQLKSLETTLAGALRREQMAETSIKELEAEIEQLNRLVRQREEDTRSTKMMLRFREDKIQRMESLVAGSIPADTYLLEENKSLTEQIHLLQAKVDRNPEVTRFALENIRLLEQLRRFQEFYEEGERDLLQAELSKLRDQLLQFLDGNSRQQDNANLNVQPGEAASINKETDSLCLELKNTMKELDECRTNLNSCLEENAKLNREIISLQSMLSNLQSAPSDGDDSMDMDTTEDLSEAPIIVDHMARAVQNEKIGEKELELLMMKHDEELLNLQLELDIVKVMLTEERAAHCETEEWATSMNRDLGQTTKKLEEAKRELDEAKSVIEALESQQILSIDQMDDLRNNNSNYMKLLSDRELEIIALKDELAIKALRDNTSSQLAENEDFPLQGKLKRMQASLEKAKRLNTWYQKDRAHEASNEEDKNEVQRQAEAETAEVIVCMQEELAALQELVQDSHLKEAETKKNLMHAEAELKELQENLHLITEDNKRLGKMLEEKGGETAEVIVCMQEELAALQEQVQNSHLKEAETKKNLIHAEAELKELQENLHLLTEDSKGLSRKLEEKGEEVSKLYEDWDLLAQEIEELLANGQEALMDASSQLEDISSSFPQRRIWISGQVGKMIRTISEKEALIEELRRCLEDANDKKSDVECMLKTLKGATLAITEAHQRDHNEREREICLLMSELSAKTTTIEKLENKMKLAEDLMKNASIGATVAFVIVNRLSEINVNHLDALKYKDIQLCDSAKTNQRKEATLNDQAAVIDEAEKQIERLKEELMESARNYGELKQKLLEEEKRSSAMVKKLEDVEENDISNARERVAELKAGISTLKSSVNMYVEHDKSLEGGDSQEDCIPGEGNGEGWIDNTRNQDGTIKSATAECIFSVGKHPGGQKTSNTERTRKYADRDQTILLLKKEIESALESLKEVQAEIAKLRNEKEDIQLSEKRSQENMKCLITQVLNLQAVMSNFEKQSGLKMEDMDSKLHAFTRIVKETGTDWYQTKEFIEAEVGDSRVVANQKTTEASCILAKFEEAQCTLKEADIIINELVIANESMKLDIEKLKKAEVTLTSERDTLLNEVESLQSINDQNFQELENLEKQFGSNLVETKDLVMELEGIVAEVQAAFMGNLVSISCEFSSMKSLLWDSKKLLRSWLEDVWSEIVVKDCAVSVLHLCHMGLLLETVTGLNTENGLLQYGVCESNSVIANLREHNDKSQQELEMCRIVEGKLLTDIKNSFDRISRKEEETGELSLKVTTFGEKIAELQLQEELMLQKSNYMGSQLAVVLKEFHMTNSDLVVSLLNQERLLKEKEEALNSEAELSMVDLYSKDFESLILASELEVTTFLKVYAEKELTSCHAVLEDLKKNVVLSMVDAELNEQFLVVKEAEVEEVSMELQDMFSKLNQNSSELKQLDEVYKTLQKENSLVKDQLCQSMETNMSLSNQVQVFEKEHEKLLKDLEMKEMALEFSSTQMSDIGATSQKLQEDIFLLETSLCKLQNELDGKNAALSNLEEENRSQESKLMKLKTERDLLLQNLESCKTHLDLSDIENHRLQDEVLSLETRIGYLQTDMEMKNAELMATMDLIGNKLSQVLNDESFATVESMFDEVLVKVGRASNFSSELECLESHAKQLISDNLSLQDELLRKDEILKGLLFDLSMLQESASNSQDQKDKLEETAASLEALEDELAAKSDELDQVVAHIQVLETQLQEKTDIISALELDISKESKSRELLASENTDLKALAANALSGKNNVEEQLAERTQVIESLEIELSEMSNTFRLMNDSVESLRRDLNEVTSERDCLLEELHRLEGKLESAEARAEENEAIATEAQEIAESRKAYAEDKEAEVKLLERSVEELECTVNVLENKVDIIKGEAERQRLQREDLELELLGLKHQMQNVSSVDVDMKRHLEEKEKNLQEVMKHVQVLEKDVADRETEIKKLKAHISELNLYAEAQASEYKQKFKALEAMAEQVKPECPPTQSSNTLSAKPEKNTTRPRGSGSPFKCIGLGLSNQIKSEKDEDLTAARQRIQELESLAVSRQKEIFSLNARLAAAESMTHDVIRDLLGLKLDMSNYASLLHNQQDQKTTEKTQLPISDSEEKDVIKMKQHLNELIKDRKGWLEESDTRQTELVSAQIALENLRQQEQLLETENDMLKVETVNLKKKVMELEGEVKKLSGQQNLQQRIHHHAKIKEENNTLKLQIEDLKARLQRGEIVLSRVKEELSHYRASTGRNSHGNEELSHHRASTGRNPHVSEARIMSNRQKNRMSLENNRLSLSSSTSSWTDENHQVPRRVSQASFLSALDR